MSALTRAGRGIAAAALLAGCASIPSRPHDSGRWVEAEGWGAVVAADTPGTRRRALADALRRAVEEEAGVFLEASVRVDKASTVRQRIVAGTRGRVVRYSTVSEREEGGFLKIRIRALVFASEANEPPIIPADYERVSVSIGAADQDSDVAASGAAAAIVDSLRLRGFQIVDAGTGGIELGGRVRAEAIRDPRLGAMSSARVRLEVSLYDPRARGPVWSVTETRAALGADQSDASSAAGGSAGREVGRRAAAVLAMGDP